MILCNSGKLQQGTVEDKKKASWENGKFLMMMYVTPAFSQINLCSRDLISSVYLQSNIARSAVSRSAWPEEQDCCGASFRASLEGQNLVVKGMVGGGGELAEQLFCSQSHLCCHCSLGPVLRGVFKSSFSHDPDLEDHLALSLCLLVHHSSNLELVEDNP